MDEAKETRVRQTHLRGLDADLYRQFRAEAVSRGYRYPSDLLNEVLRAWLENAKREGGK